MSGYVAYAGGKTPDEAQSALDKIVQALPGAFQFGDVRVVPVTSKNKQWWDDKIIRDHAYVAMRMVRT